MSKPKDKEEKSEFEILLDLATSRMLSALCGYHIWKWIGVAININNLAGEKVVKRNLEVMNRHTIFFQQIISSTYKSFVADLAIFFDKDNRNDIFSLKKLLRATEDKLKANEVEELNKEIEKIRLQHGININFLKKLRNADVAHQEIDSKSRLLLYKNVEGLFIAVQDILNLISKRYGRFEHWWSLRSIDR